MKKHNVEDFLELLSCTFEELRWVQQEAALQENLCGAHGGLFMLAVLSESSAGA